MTEDFERELHEMLNERVAGMPASYDASPQVLARAQRRRALKLTSVVAAALVVVVGTAAVVAGSFGRSTSHISVAKPSSAFVTTVACPIAYALTGGSGFPPPVLDPRLRVGGDPEQYGRLVSYAATNDPRYVVLGPKGWSCRTQVSADGQNAVTVAPPSSSPAGAPSISILNDYLWHGGVGAPQACRVFHDQELLNYVAANYPQQSCRRTGRTTTHVDEHVVTFVDADGTRGAGWMVLPTSVNGPDDGKFSVLSCRPGAGLTDAECDTVVADWTTRAAVAPQIATNAVMLAAAPFAALDRAPTSDGMFIVGPVGKGVAAYDAAADTWRTYAVPPFAGLPCLVAVRDNTAFVMAVPQALSTTTPFAALDLATGKWQSRAPVPAGVPVLRGAGDATHIFGVGAFESNGDYPPGTIAVEYDVTSDRWTKLPASPLGARAGSELAWTGKELIVWSGGSNHQGAVPPFADGAAYSPETGIWRSLPTAPISGRAWAATAWTGTEMLVWGGDDCGCFEAPRGQNAAYNPATNKWRTLPASPVTASRVAAGTWTGKEFVVLGGGAPREVGVAAYNPSTNTWRSLPAPPEGAHAMGDAALAEYVGGRVVLAPSAQGQLALFAYPAGT